MILTSRMPEEEARSWMWIEHLLLGLFGLCAGAAVSAGAFAFLLMLNIVPRMVGKTRTGQEIMLYENMIILGAVFGNLITVFLGWRIPLGHIFLGLYGIGAGFFVGCMAAALAEILKAFPILFRRAKLKMGLWAVVLFMALGKSLGSLYYFFNQVSDK